MKIVSVPRVENGTKINHGVIGTGLFILKIKTIQFWMNPYQEPNVNIVLFWQSSEDKDKNAVCIISCISSRMQRLGQIVQGNVNLALGLSSLQRLKPSQSCEGEGCPCIIVPVAQQRTKMAEGKPAWILWSGWCT